VGYSAGWLAAVLESIFSGTFAPTSESRSRTVFRSLTTRPKRLTAANGSACDHPEAQEAGEVQVSAPRFMPEQKPGRSVQEVGTPRIFLDAVEARFGKLEFDLAANIDNSICGPDFYGPGSFNALDGLSTWWGGKPLNMWLNPPYGNIAPWAAKCARDRHPEGRIAFVPASVGSNWFADHVDGKALVLFLRPRLTFVGHTQSYPKDLILAMYGEKPGYECWRWKP
jgi:phage N-6-adenine-methyltransferase